MTYQAPLSLETLKLRLVSSMTAPASDPLMTTDGIHYLLKALAYADATFSTEIEHVLVKAGTLAIPELIKALAEDNLNVRSVAAMALIRLGKASEEALILSYVKTTHKKPSLRWIYEFIFQELCLDIPAVATSKNDLHLTLSRVG